MISFLIQVLAGMIVLEFILRRKYGMKYSFTRKKPVNKIHRWTERMMAIISVCISIALAFSFHLTFEQILLILFTYFFVHSCISTYMEFKYDREAKEYVISGMTAFLFIVLIVGTYYYSTETVGVIFLFK